MADNVTFQTTTATPANGTVVASDDVGGVQYQRVKIALGAPNAYDTDVDSGQQTSANSVPVVIASDQSAVEVQGDAAHDAAAAGNPVLLGAYASSSAPTDVSANGDAVRLWADRAGRLQVGDGGGSLTVDGTVAVTSGTGATDLGKVEDAAHASGDVGIMALAVRRDADTTLAGTDGDYAPLQVNAAGSLKVAITAGGGTGGTAMVDDAAFTPGTTNITPMGAMFDDVAPDSVNEGDGGVVRMSGNRNLYVTIRDAAGNERGLNVDASGFVGVTDGGGSLTVDGTITANLAAGTNNIGDVDVLSVVPGTGATNLGKAEDAAHTTGDVGVMALAVRADTPAAGAGTDGDYSALLTDSSGRLHVAGVVQGTAAHDAVASGNPIQMGGVAESTRPTAVADADAVRAWYDTMGRQVVAIGSGESNYVAAEYTSNQSDASVIAAPGPGLSIVIYDILVSTGAAGTVLFEEGTTTRLFGRISLAANGGWSFNSSKGVKLGANTALTITTTTSAGPLAVTVNYAILP